MSEISTNPTPRYVACPACKRRGLDWCAHPMLESNPTPKLTAELLLLQQLRDERDARVCRRALGEAAQLVRDFASSRGPYEEIDLEALADSILSLTTEQS